MRPGKFLLNPSLVSPFGKTRVTEIARALRKLGLFPKGKRHSSDRVTPGQALVFLYLLAADAKPSDMHLHLDHLACINSNPDGARFFDDLLKLFTDRAKLAQVSEIEISNNFKASIFTAIRYNDGTDKVYNPIPSGVRPSCRLSGDYLRRFVGELAEDFTANWSHTYRAKKAPTPITTQTLEKLAEACMTATVQTEKP